MKNRDFQAWKRELYGKAPHLLTLAVRNQIDVSPALRLALEKLVQAITMSRSIDEIKLAAEGVQLLPVQNLLIKQGTAEGSFPFLANFAQNNLSRIVEVCERLSKASPMPAIGSLRHQAQA